MGKKKESNIDQSYEFTDDTSTYSDLSSQNISRHDIDQSSTDRSTTVLTTDQSQQAVNTDINISQDELTQQNMQIMISGSGNVAQQYHGGQSKQYVKQEAGQTIGDIILKASIPFVVILIVGVIVMIVSKRK